MVDDRMEGPGLHPVIVTQEMEDAGLDALYGFHITEPDDDEMREAVREVFITMLEVQTARALYVLREYLRSRIEEEEKEAEERRKRWIASTNLLR
jgi:hypothetical protein